MQLSIVVLHESMFSQYCGVGVAAAATADRHSHCWQDRLNDLPVHKHYLYHWGCAPPYGHIRINSSIPYPCLPHNYTNFSFIHRMNGSFICDSGQFANMQRLHFSLRTMKRFAYLLLLPDVLQNIYARLANPSV